MFHISGGFLVTLIALLAYAVGYLARKTCELADETRLGQRRLNDHYQQIEAVRVKLHNTRLALGDVAKDVNRIDKTVHDLDKADASNLDIFESITGRLTAVEKLSILVGEAVVKAYDKNAGPKGA